MPLNQTCQIRKFLKIIPAGRALYEELACFHYRDKPTGPTTHIFAILDEHPLRRPTVPAAGVIVYRPPVPNLGVRNAVTGGFFTGLPRAAGLSLLNEHVRCISRVIIDPRYRGLGLASWLVRETMAFVDVAMIEATSIMGRFHPFFKRAGMQEFSPAPDVKTERMAAAMETVGIDENLWTDAEQVHGRIDSLDASHRAFIEQQIDRFLQKFASQRNMGHSLKRTDFVLSKLTPPGNYYLWLNPDRQLVNGAGR